MEAIIQTSVARPDGRKEAFCTASVPAKEKVLPWQAARLTYTATGYGRRIPTRYMVRWGGKWRRVYASRISNVGTLYVGELADGIIVRGIDND